METLSQAPGYHTTFHYATTNQQESPSSISQLVFRIKVIIFNNTYIYIDLVFTHSIPVFHQTELHVDPL